MKILMTLALLLQAAIALPAAASSYPSDLAPLQGTWQLVYGERDGVTLSSSQTQATRIVFTGDQFFFPSDTAIGTSPSGRLTVDATVTPHRMDSLAADGVDAGRVSYGIYRIEGDLYTVDFAAPGAPRPTEFTAPAGSGRLLQIWKRQP